MLKLKKHLISYLFLIVLYDYPFPGRSIHNDRIDLLMLHMLRAAK